VLRVDLPDVCFQSMLYHMRTTLNIDDQLMARVKERAAASGRTITDVVEQALRAEVAGSRAQGAAFVLRWKAVSGKVLPGVDLADRDSLYQTMEGKP
jgi:predicted transcriptional regulator